MYTKKIVSCLRYSRNVSHSIRKYSESKASTQNLKSLLDDASSFSEEHSPSDKWTSSPYPVKIHNRSQQSPRINIDPSATSVILFPGQGTQYVGMAKQLVDYPNVIDMFDCASEILRYNLLDLCIHGPIDMLNMTVHSQAAVMVSSLAAIEKLRAQDVKMVENCVATAGFSVGEYAALVFAGAIEFEHAVKLLKVRGEAMQAASDLQPSGMMTVFLSTQAKINYACKAAREWCEMQEIGDPECRVAIHLFPHCKVVAGHMEALKFLESNGADYGIKKVKHIPVSGAFHSKLMLPAKNVLQKALKATPIETPLIPVHANIDGKPYPNPDHIRKKLAQQLCEPIAWEQTMHRIFEREQGVEFPNTFECGPGSTLRTVLKMNNNAAYKKSSNVNA